MAFKISINVVFCTNMNEGEQKFSIDKHSLERFSFLFQHTDIPKSVFLKAEQSIQDNPYHNFPHELNVAENAIRIALAEFRNRKELNLLGTSGLFHDAGHTGIPKDNDEENANEIMFGTLTPEEIAKIGDDPEITKEILGILVLGTKFKDRGKSEDLLVKIIQDADLSLLGGDEYEVAYGSMKLLDEFNMTKNENISPLTFLRETQKKFIEYVVNMSPTKKEFFLTDGAKKIFRNPLETISKFENWSDKAINFTYEAHRNKLQFDEYKQGITRLNNK